MTVNEIYLLEEAEEDLENGKIFYDDNEPGVGAYFWDSMISEIESLYLYAGVHEIKYNFYKMITKRFPYAIYYYISNSEVYVVAVLPMKKDPRWIRKRLNFQ